MKHKPTDVGAQDVSTSAKDFEESAPEDEKFQRDLDYAAEIQATLLQMLNPQTQTRYIRDVRGDLSSSLDLGPEISGLHDANAPDLENNALTEWPSYSTSSKTIASPSLIYNAISDELHVSAERHQPQRPGVTLPGLILNQGQYGGFHAFHEYLSRLLVYIYDSGIIFCISLVYFLRSNKYTNWLAKFVISAIFLISAVWYFVTAFNAVSVYQIAGANFSSKLPYNSCQLPEYRPCWFEEPSLGSRLAQVNNKLVNIADIAVLETIPTDLTLTQEKVAELHVYIRRSSKDPSAQVLLQLLEYGSESTYTRSRVSEFIGKFEGTMMQVYLITQSTIERLRYISKIEVKHAHFVRVIICVFDNLFGGYLYWTDTLRCSTSLCASQFITHVDEVVSYIQMQEADASRLVQLFGTLRGHLKDADDIQRRHQFQKMMHFYQTHQTNQTNQTDDIDSHIWSRLKAFLESKIWTTIKAFFVGKNSITTSLETLAPETNSLQLILPFIEWAEEYFDGILSSLKELEDELRQSRKIAEEQESWTAIRCAFKKPPIRSWTRQLKSSFRIRILLPKGPEGQRKIGMFPNVETWE